MVTHVSVKTILQNHPTWDVDLGQSVQFAWDPLSHSVHWALQSSVHHSCCKHILGTSFPYPGT